MRTFMLSPTEEKILQALDRHLAQHEEAPTLEELGHQVQIHSRGTMHRHVSRLVEAGYLARSPRHWRGLRVVKQPDMESPIARLPLVGRIAAGKPIEAIESHDEVNLGELLCRPGRYVLQVVGDSMTGMGLLDGDYVVIEQQNHAQNGQVVVALVDGEEATLKRYTHKDGVVTLSPENKAHEPQVYPAERVLIQGVLAGQMRVYQ